MAKEDSMIKSNSVEFGSFILGEIWSKRLVNKPDSWYYKGRKVHILLLYAAFIKSEYQKLIDEVKAMKKVKIKPSTNGK